MEPQETYVSRRRADLPNSTAVLVLGILSIVLCWCYGIVGIIMAVIALVLSGKSRKSYSASPELYEPNSYRNLNAGRICAIVGLCLSVGYLIMTIFVMMTGALDAEDPWDVFGKGF